MYLSGSVCMRRLLVNLVLPLMAIVGPDKATTEERPSRTALAECNEAVALLPLIRVGTESLSPVEAELRRQVIRAEDAGYLRAYCQALFLNFSAKVASSREEVTFSAEQIRQTGILFEQFRLETYVSSGVFPKRYFGFLDEAGKTAPFEVLLREVSSKAVPFLNSYAESIGVKSRVTPKEIVMTHLAEGGALLLTDEFESINRIHPVRHVGLDDYRKGFSQFPGLIERIDTSFGTRLNYLSLELFGRSTLLRPMTFTESVLATGIMYLYEKELTEGMRLADGRCSLMTLPLDEQFVHASLVYNSGILFSDERVRQILAFDTADYLATVSVDNRATRRELPVLTRAQTLGLLGRGEQPVLQLTSWNAAYHILQRYGAWVAVTKFSDTFDDRGYFRRHRESSH